MIGYNAKPELTIGGPFVRTISSALVKPIQFVGSLVGVALIFALLMLVVISWRALHLVVPVREHLAHLTELQLVAGDTRGLLIRQIGRGPAPTAPDVAALRDQLGGLIEHDGNLDAGTPSGLDRARAALDTFPSHPRSALVAALVDVQGAIAAESRAQAGLIEKTHDYALREFRIAIATFLGLPILAFLAFNFLKGRFLSSFDRLSGLLERLGTREFVPAPVDSSDRDLAPVLESYNHLVERLAAAESENIRRRDELEDQVRAATGAVLRQGRELADADRLAAVGETSARIAHELRNPLAGLELALKNLQAECRDSDTDAGRALVARLDPLIGELQRMSRLLASLLDQRPLMPEPAVPTNLGACIRETVSLARYQTPDSISIEASLADDLTCAVPRDTLRQVVFNLLLNAVQAIGARRGTIEVVVARDGERAVLAIADDGPGFPDDILERGPRMFMPRRPGGTGIGLPTVRRLTEQMGARMELANRAAGGGAVVTISLPCGGGDA